MNDQYAALLLGSAVVAALIYAAQRLRESTAALAQIRSAMKSQLAETRALRRNLRRQQGATHAIREYLLPVSKGSSNRHS